MNVPPKSIVVALVAVAGTRCVTVITGKCRVKPTSRRLWTLRKCHLKPHIKREPTGDLNHTLLYDIVLIIASHLGRE